MKQLKLMQIRVSNCDRALILIIFNIDAFAALLYLVFKAASSSF